MVIDFAAILRWFWEAILYIVKSMHGGACLLGITMGIALAEFLAHMLPPGMDSYYADRVTRLTCFGVSLCVTFALDVTLTGLFLAILAGLAGPTCHGLLIRWIAFRWPALTARALIPGPGDIQAPRPILPIPAEKTPDGGSSNP